MCLLKEINDMETAQTTFINIIKTVSEDWDNPHSELKSNEK